MSPNGLHVTRLRLRLRSERSVGPDSHPKGEWCRSPSATNDAVSEAIRVGMFLCGSNRTPQDVAHGSPSRRRAWHTCRIYRRIDVSVLQPVTVCIEHVANERSTGHRLSARLAYKIALPPLRFTLTRMPRTWASAQKGPKVITSALLRRFASARVRPYPRARDGRATQGNGQPSS